jgi:A/G-specific adenine glycosylase
LPVKESVSDLVVRWQESHGRHHLPWQQTKDPYRVWLSEIMLQQTQVTTVLDYYKRFLDRFPDVGALAQASQDEVMGMWSGLGYYTRARNLHRCAQQVMTDHHGRFPRTAEVLATLPGIGRSTASAISAFCFSERVAILDANVRRVLTRVLGFSEDLASTKNERLLWGKAEALLPEVNLLTTMPRYTQGLMDLGSSICTPRSPQCGDCPLVKACVAAADGRQEQYPVKTRKLKRRSESWILLILKDPTGRVWLQRRPSTGIWAGMHCTPVFHDEAVLQDFVAAMGGNALPLTRHELPPFVHVLTHRDLHLHPIVVTCAMTEDLGFEGGWLGSAQWDSVGLPAPIRKLLGTAQASLW